MIEMNMNLYVIFLLTIRMKEKMSLLYKYEDKNKIKCS